jgi:hypothetical protein
MLRFSDLTWLARMRAGLTLLVVGDAIQLGVLLCLWIRSWPTLTSALLAIATLATVVNTAGVLKATAAEEEGAAGFSARQIARSLAVPVCTLAVLRRLVRSLPFVTLSSGSAGLELLISAMATVLAVSFIVYLLTLLRRTPHSSVRFVAWAAMAELGLSFCFGGMLQLAPAYRIWPMAWILAILGDVLLLLLMVLARGAVGSERRIAIGWQGELAPTAQPESGVTAS